MKTKRRPAVSVIVTTYNRLELLKRALASVRRQTFGDFEIIVADAGSDDGTRDYLRDARAPLRVVSVEGNPGLAALMNAGLAVARGRYVAILESDDYWRPGYLAAMVAAFKNGKVRCASCECWIATAAGDVVMRFHWRDAALLAPDIAGCEDRWDSGARFHWGWHLSFTVFRRDVFAELGPFDPGLKWAGVEVDLYMRMTLAYGAEAFTRVNRPLGAWTRHSAQLSETIYNMQLDRPRASAPSAAVDALRRDILLDGAYFQAKHPLDELREVERRLARKESRKFYFSVN